MSLPAKPNPSPPPGRRPIPRLLAISDRRSLAGGDLPAWLRQVAQAGVDAVQLREKDLDDRALYELALEARRILPASMTLLVNGRLDVALAAGADGAHLPVNGPPVALLRRRFGAGVLLGCSTHSLEEVLVSQAGGAD
ncbi:MAG: thiamine phosphate synthase, partial [Acidobacteria bacterium]|nr:thiamine phosphate synthase [Acidobacteriota bacterium]